MTAALVSGAVTVDGVAAVVVPYRLLLLPWLDVIVAEAVLSDEGAELSAFLFLAVRGLTGAVFLRARLTVSSSSIRWTVGLFSLVAASQSFFAFTECSVLSPELEAKCTSALGVDVELELMDVDVDFALGAFTGSELFVMLILCLTPEVLAWAIEADGVVPESG